MKNITINTKNRTIELSKAFSKIAYEHGTDEYKQLQEARRDYPNFRVITVKQKSTAKADFQNLSFNYMDEYVKKHIQTEDLKKEYLSLRALDEDWNKDKGKEAAGYQVIKDWFLNNFPEFERFRADRLALLDKIQKGKEARLAARKRVA